MSLAQDPLSPDPASTARNARLVAARFWPKLRGSVNRLPFVADLLAAYYCAIDPATPMRVKGVLLGALAYFILPADLVPDFLIGLGFTDDATALLSAVQAVRAHLTPAHYERARAALAAAKQPLAECHTDAPSSSLGS